MATKTSNGTGGGNWSAGSTWVGGVTPIDGDTVVIAAGDTVTFDVDMTSWANGIAGMTIEGGDTAAILRFKYSAAGIYYLKVRSGTMISGSSGAVKGRLLVNGTGVWGDTTPLPYDRKAIIHFVGGYNNRFHTTDLDIALYCTEPDTKYVECYGTCYTVTFSASTDRATFNLGVSAINDGTPVTFTGTLPTPLVAGTTYYLRDKSSNTFKIAATYDGSPIDLTTAGSGAIYCHIGRFGPVNQAAAVDTVTGMITWNGTAPVQSTKVRLSSTGVLPSGLRDDVCYYVRAVSGTTCKLSRYDNDYAIVVPTDTESGDLTMYTGGYVDSTAINVLQSVTSDPQWVTTDGDDYVFLLNTTGSGTGSAPAQLTTIAPQYMVLSSSTGTGSMHPLARLYLLSRNVRVLCYNNYSYNVMASGSPNPAIFKCEIRNTNSSISGTFAYGAPVHFLGGTISGFSTAVQFSSPYPTAQLIDAIFLRNQTTFSGGFAADSTVQNLTVGACNSFIQDCLLPAWSFANGFLAGAGYFSLAAGDKTISNAVFLATTVGVRAGVTVAANVRVHNAQTGFSGAVGAKIYGTAVGCNNGLSGGGNFYGRIEGCMTGAAYSDGLELDPSSVIRDCSTGIFDSRGLVAFRGLIENGFQGIYGDSNGAGLIIVAGTIQNVRTPILSANCYILNPTIAGQTTTIQSSSGDPRRPFQYGYMAAGPPFTSHKTSGSSNESRSGILLWDYLGIPGWVGAFNLGGSCASASYDAEEHGIPPQPTEVIHEMLFEDNRKFHWFEFPVLAKAGSLITLTLYGKLTGTSLWTTRPTIGLYDQRLPWQSPGECLGVSSVMADHTEWQTVTATAVAPVDGEYRVRVQGVGGTSDGTGTEKLYCFYTITGAAGAGGVIVIGD